MEIIEKIDVLKQVDSTETVLSIYLNTDAADPDQRGGKWKTTLKSGLNELENTLKENKDELKKFQSLKKEVEQFAQDHERNLKKSMVIFASSDKKIWFFEQLQVRVKSEFHWEKKPVLTQLNSLVKTYQKSGVIIVQHHAIHVLETILNRSKYVKEYEMDIETEDWKEMVGPRKPYHSSGMGSHNAQVDNFEARFKANENRWYKRIAGNLDKLAKDQSWESIFIIGETDVAHALDKAMNKDVEKVIHKNMLGQPEEKIIEEVFA